MSKSWQTVLRYSFSSFSIVLVFATMFALHPSVAVLVFNYLLPLWLLWLLFAWPAITLTSNQEPSNVRQSPLTDDKTTAICSWMRSAPFFVRSSWRAQCLGYFLVVVIVCIVWQLNLNGVEYLRNHATARFALIVFNMVSFVPQVLALTFVFALLSDMGAAVLQFVARFRRH